MSNRLHYFNNAMSAFMLRFRIDATSLLGYSDSILSISTIFFIGGVLWRSILKVFFHSFSEALYYLVHFSQIYYLVHFFLAWEHISILARCSSHVPRCTLVNWGLPHRYPLLPMRLIHSHKSAHLHNQQQNRRLGYPLRLLARVRVGMLLPRSVLWAQGILPPGSVFCWWCNSRWK